MSRSKAASAVAALSALVALLSLMNERGADPADLLQPVRQPGEGGERGGHCGRRHAEPHGSGAGGERVLDVVLSAQRADAGEIGEVAERPGPRRAGDQLAADRVPAVADARARRDDVDPGAVGEAQALGDVAAPVVVVADDGVARVLAPAAP